MEAGSKKWNQEYLKAWNSLDADKVASFFSPTGIYQDKATGAVYRGKEEVKTYVARMARFSPDFKLELKSSFATGNWGAAEWTMTGINAGGVESVGLPANNMKYSIEGVSITQFRRGKIVRNTDYWNLAAFLQQLGAMPASPKK